MTGLTFDQLPNAVATMLHKMESLEQRLMQLLTSSPADDRPMGVTEAAEFLGIPKNTLYGMTSRREILCFKAGKHLKFRRKDLWDWVMEGRQETAAQIQSAARKGVRRA
ncbi:helix-turn-helix domain-containing protein [Rufibacter glacialis]|uniref:Helix-turn-helix domain-containing protein n=1 Tax=Rufibacter glacialis TaxID=1259555 RepID=A0A5M8QL54_9BACT|nr:helix-turn-helix domain-containing protein [Rufibacter glacialis]KAA6435496.1 helix-turn-helix domain-containing protein [Rufibacter glacialis]GGK64045.1 hypothetical protein GCM10011405_10000 [Rufibacter glacialis]